MLAFLLLDLLSQLRSNVCVRERERERERGRDKAAKMEGGREGIISPSFFSHLFLSLFCITVLNELCTTMHNKNNNPR
jgi:hypothetical protein